MDTLSRHWFRALGRMTGKSTSGPESAAVRKAKQDGDIEYLLAALADPHVRQSAAIALGDLGDPVATDPLLRLLRAHDWPVRAAAANGLSRLGDPRAVPALVELAQHEPEPWARMWAVEALRKVGDPAAAAGLRPLLADESFSIRRWAAVTLASLGDPLGREKLAAMRRRPRLLIVTSWALFAWVEPRIRLPWPLSLLLAGAWITALVVIGDSLGGWQETLADAATLLVLTEAWLRLREHEAFRQHVYFIPKEERVKFTSWVALVIYAGLISGFIGFFWTVSLVALANVFVLSWRLIVELFERDAVRVARLNAERDAPARESPNPGSHVT